MVGKMKIKSFNHDKKTRIIFFITFLCMCLSGLVRTHYIYGAEIVDRIVAQVNDDIITLYDLNRSIEPFVEKIKASGYPVEQERKVLYKVREDVLNDLIEDKLTDQEVRKSGITIGAKEVDNAIERVKELNYYTEEEFKVALAEDGMTLDDFKKDIKEQLLRAKLVNWEVKSKIVITKADIKAYYQQHLDKYGGKEAYHLRSIVKRIPPFADETEKQSILSQMESILKELSKGESFEVLARRSSDFLASEGGDLGLFGIEDLSPQIQQAISGLREGEHTSIIDTDQGYQIFYLQEIVEIPGKSIESVSDEIETILFKEIVNQKFSEWVENIKKRSHIKIVK